MNDAGEEGERIGMQRPAKPNHRVWFFHRRRA
jgi:hypothetical protein